MYIIVKGLLNDTERLANIRPILINIIHKYNMYNIYIYIECRLIYLANVWKRMLASFGGALIKLILLIALTQKRHKNTIF